MFLFYLAIGLAGIVMGLGMICLALFGGIPGFVGPKRAVTGATAMYWKGRLVMLAAGPLVVFASFLVIAEGWGKGEVNQKQQLFDEAMASGRAKQWEQAVAGFTKVIEDKGPAPSGQPPAHLVSLSHLNRGNCYYELARYGEAAADLEVAKAVASADNLALLTNCYLKVGKAQEAKRAFEEACAKHLKNVDFRKAYTLAMRDLGDAEGAMTGYAWALRANNIDVEGLLGRGECYRALNRLDEAKADHTRAVQLRPSDANAQLQLAVTLLCRGEYTAAGVPLNALSKQNPADASARLLKWVASGRSAGATAAGAPVDATGVQLDAWWSMLVNVCSGAATLEQGEAVARSAGEERERARRLSDLYYLYGQRLAMQRQTAGAIAQWEKCMGVQPANVFVESRQMAAGELLRAKTGQNADVVPAGRQPRTPRVRQR